MDGEFSDRCACLGGVADDDVLYVKDKTRAPGDEVALLGEDAGDAAADDAAAQE
jgi:hypothetical protein